MVNSELTQQHFDLKDVPQRKSHKCVKPVTKFSSRMDCKSFQNWSVLFEALQFDLDSF